MFGCWPKNEKKSTNNPYLSMPDEESNIDNADDSSCWPCKKKAEKPSSTSINSDNGNKRLTNPPTKSINIYTNESSPPSPTSSTYGSISPSSLRRIPSTPNNKHTPVKVITTNYDESIFPPPNSLSRKF